jgi:hypothetical protein
MDIILGVGGNTVLSRRWRYFALGHRLRVGDHLIFHFKLGTLEASVWTFTATGVRRTYPQPESDGVKGQCHPGGLWGEAN